MLGRFLVRAILLFLAFISLAWAQAPQKVALDAEGHPWWKHAVFYENLSAQFC
jgi:hypothetical protein